MKKIKLIENGEWRMENGEWRMADEIALRFPQRAFHQAENWVVRIGI
jgi:hypothetical protein